MDETEIKNLLDDYLRWLKDRTIVNKISEEWVKITTPHLDRHNDYLQIYVRKDGSLLELTDGGYIISDLANSGCSLDAPKRQKLLNATLNGFGVKLDKESLVVRTVPNAFPQKKHDLLQAMIAVNDLFYLASSHIANFFLEDVANWLDVSGIRYSPRVKLIGKSGFDHCFDFVIPKSNKKEERLVKVLSNPQKDSAQNIIFQWQDTKEVREIESSLCVFLNDTEEKISKPVMDAFENYSLRPILWSCKEDVYPELAA